ncbi:DUF2231 domain-containing protein [Rhodanobacter sp. C05]|uniref:DUF2231 domain-containing protein n=1 Tax=Rhodanobacter sp. C05 TaxID=1945855 RepID=UPI000986F5D0|nr:DUF2231 domain-containing protein [Rhodanobacter sp. C05]OOG41510.1 hypothetical protein B0E51_07430 [Rhodanobacter sp. C05]
MRHPLHPALVHFPIAGWSLATAADLASLGWGEPAWRFAGVLLLAGIGFSIPAMLAGFLELTKIAEDHPAIKDVNRHMIVVMTALAFYATSLFLRLQGTTLTKPGVLAIALSVTGFLFLCAGGWLGGKLVYGHRLGVGPSSPP